MKEIVLSESIIEKFYEYLVYEEKSTATVDKYIRDVRAFCSFAGKERLTKDLVINYKNMLIEKGYAIRSINSMLASLNSMFAFLKCDNCRVKNIKIQRQIYCTEDRELTKAEYMRLLKAAKNNCQLSLILQTICSTGIRVSELQYFTVEGIRCGEVMVNCKGKTRMILIPEMLKKLLLDYAKKKKIQAGLIFLTRNGRPVNRSNIWLQMKKLCYVADVKESKVFPHNLRKLFARTFYSVEKDIAKLADILGHSSIDTTRIYIITSGTEHRRKIEQLGLIIQMLGENMT